jgi:hypothetical protein
MHKRTFADRRSSGDHVEEDDEDGNVHDGDVITEALVTFKQATGAAAGAASSSSSTYGSLSPSGPSAAAASSSVRSPGPNAPPQQQVTPLTTPPPIPQRFFRPKPKVPERVMTELREEISIANHLVNSLKGFCVLCKMETQQERVHNETSCTHWHGRFAVCCFRCCRFGFRSVSTWLPFVPL